MTALFPTHKQEEWRYADLDALKPVWEQFAEPVTLTVAAGEELELRRFGEAHVKFNPPVNRRDV